MVTIELDNAILKGYRLVGIGQFDSAIIYLNNLKDYFIDPLEKIFVEIEIAWCLENKGEYEESQEVFLSDPCRVFQDFLLESAPLGFPEAEKSAREP